MEINFNLGSLKVVKEHLQKYIQEGISSIEQNINTISVQKNLPNEYNSIDLINKTSKTLDVIGLKGVAKVLFLCSESISYVKSGKSNLKTSLEILEKNKIILEKLNIYLNKIINSGFDQATKFFEEYKKLAKLIEKEVSIKDLFYPKLEIKKTFNQNIQKDLRFGIFLNDNIKKYLKSKISETSEKVFSIFEKLEELIKNNSFIINDKRKEINDLCYALYEELDFLQKIKINKTSYVFFGLAKLYVCSIAPKFNNKIEEYLKENSNNALNVLKALFNTTEDLYNFIDKSKDSDKTTAFLIKESYICDLLFEMKIVEHNEELKNMPIFKEVNNYFDFNYYLNQINETFAYIEFRKDELEVSSKIKDLFSDIKKLSESLINNNSNYAENITTLSANLVDFSACFNSYPSIKNLIDSLLLLLNKIYQENIEINQDFKKELSLTIILLDYGIENYTNEIVDPRNLEDFTQQTQIQIERLQSINNEKLILDKFLPIPRFNLEKETEPLSKILYIYNSQLKSIEDSLDYFLKNNGENINDIINLPKILNEIKIIFSSTEKKEVSKLIDFILKPWVEIIENKTFDVDIFSLKESIEFLGGISLLVKSYSEGNTIESEEIYDNLICKFDKINYVESHQQLEDVFIETNKLEMNFQDNTIEDATEVNNNNKINVENEMNSENKTNNSFNILSDENWSLLQELETTRFSIANKKKREKERKLINEQEEVVIQSFIGNFDLSQDSEKQENVVQSSDSKEYWVSDSTNDPELADIFLLEAQEVLENLENEFKILVDDIDNIESLTNLRRFYHTLKGSGRMVGLKYLSEVAWMAEQTLNKCLSKELIFDKNLLTLLIETKEKFKEWLSCLQINNLISLDLIEIRDKFLLVNKDLTTSFEIEFTKEISGKMDKIEQNVISSNLEEDNSIINDKEEEESQNVLSNEQENIVESTFDNQDTIQNVIEDNSIIDDKEKEEVQSVLTSEQENIIDTSLELKKEDKLNDDFIIIDNVRINKNTYEKFNNESEELIDYIKKIINFSFEDNVFLGERFVELFKNLEFLADSVKLEKLSQLSNNLQEIGILANKINIGLSQVSLNTLRHVVNSLTILKSVNPVDQARFYEGLKEILINLKQEILEYSNTGNVIFEDESNLKEEISMEKIEEIKNELRQEMMVILKEKDLVLKTIVENLIESQEQNKKLVEKIEGLESDIEKFKVNREQKDKMFLKALEVNRGDIKVLIDLIKKR